MRKEVIVAVLLGGSLGLAIAFGVWRANLALKPQSTTSEQISATNSSSPTPVAGTLLVTEPEENSLVSTESITVRGKAEPRSTIVVTTPVDAKSVAADNSGNWIAELRLAAGANAVLVTAVSESGEELSTQITVTYSTEFKEE
ncbi:hypothetical protein HYZ78_04005 [Candidatus Microgenomates bacterium]|nr:hypothetical protein [Candidatus Microgenomates bacterium]